ncbi:MAG: hypothetical protein CL943_01195 [Candidatus Diapherotrites archaeon]|uniref:Carbohydrate-binding module family 96 domain-containing protein n=1 Tax=Candidatus Iainarchaeum sp. TaxID=3101447 RepID=A0A2D6M0G0_9ARCH|nr:hypothetical protein [Candidatus Diapherotrites archaeon]
MNCKKLATALLLLLFTIGTQAATLNLTETDVQANLSYDQSYTKRGVQWKWDISGLPGGATITTASHQLYLASVDGTMDNDVRLWYIADQSWDESSSYADLQDQETANQEDSTFSSIEVSTWANVDVTDQLQAAVDNGDSSFTVRMEDPDGLLIPVIFEGASAANLRFARASGNEFYFEDRADNQETG